MVVHYWIVLICGAAEIVVADRRNLALEAPLAAFVPRVPAADRIFVACDAAGVSVRCGKACTSIGSTLVAVVPIRTAVPFLGQPVDVGSVGVHVRNARGRCRKGRCEASWAGVGAPGEVDVNV